MGDIKPEAKAPLITSAERPAITKHPSPQSTKRITELSMDDNTQPLIQSVKDDNNKINTRPKHASCDLTSINILEEAEMEGNNDSPRSWDKEHTETNGDLNKKVSKKDEVYGMSRARSSSGPNSLKRFSLKLNLSRRKSIDEKIVVDIPLDGGGDEPQDVVPKEIEQNEVVDTKAKKPSLERTSSAPSVTSMEKIPAAKPVSPGLTASVSDGKINFVFPHISSGDLSGARKVVAATEDQLICMLAGETAPDKDFVVHFILTHHRFIKSKDLLNKLVNRYKFPTPEHYTAAEAEEHTKKKRIVQVRVINVIKKWLERLIVNFQQDPQLLLLLQQFIQTLLKSGGTEAIWASNLQLALLQAEESQENPARIFISTATAPKVILPKNTIAHQLHFLDIHPEEAARQLTLIESESLSRISPAEYWHKGWSTPEGETTSPNVLEIITRFNKLCYWIASEIMRVSDLQKRVKMLSRFIKFGAMLRAMNNLQGVMTVISALNMSSVQRLHETWKALPNKYTVMFESITNLMSSAHNYKVYRDMLKTASPPLIPFQGVYLGDLTFMEEAPDFLEKDMINFRKMVLVGDVLNDVQKFQQVRYVFLEVPCIKEYLLRFTSALDDKTLHELSRKIEPKK